jgi:hypothetical protein
MSKSDPVDVYLERGAKKVFAGAIEWPGWARSGRDDDAALEALVAYGARYAAVVKGMEQAFSPPSAPSRLQIVERLMGDATTDFGAPSIAPKADARSVDTDELARQQALLRSSWDAFDRAVEAAEGVELAKGPRGGGRDLAAIVSHVVGAEASYAGRLGAPKRAKDDDAIGAAIHDVRRAALDAMTRGVAEGLPAAGPRGGKIWTVRYFVRRAAWHVLDHAWEIEDRSAPI